MKKKSLALVAIAVVIVASIVTTYTLAYFTDAKEATNNFTVGNVEITLTEDKWEGGGADGAGMKANPGVAVAKNPMVTNDGDNDAYVRLDVIVTEAAMLTQPDSTNPYDLFNKINMGDGAKQWTLTDGPTKTDDDNWVYSYQYNSVLPVAQTGASADLDAHKTSELFTTVTLPASFDQSDVEALDGFKIIVKAYAIQKEGFDGPAAAFTALATAIADGE